MPAILIVEDEAKMRRLLELDLGEDGFTTFSAEDAETGLKLLQQNPVDLVVTELAVIAFPEWTSDTLRSWSRHLCGTSNRSDQSRTRRATSVSGMQL